MRSLINFFRFLRENGWERTWDRWKYNYAMLDTPEQLLRKEVFGYVGAMFGLLIGLVFMFFRGLWFISVVMGFSCFIMNCQLKSKLRQLRLLKNIKEEFESQIDDIGGDVK